MSDRLAAARLYLVAPARLAAGQLHRLVPELAAAGVDLVQLREKEMEAGDLLRVGAPIADACAEAGIPFIVNDRPDVALGLGADGVHLGRNDLPVALARRIFNDAIVGCSTHSAGDLADVAASGDRVDYVAVGPVFATPTKPGRPATGTELLRHAAATAAVPWFAIGGIDEHRLPKVLDAGARRIVVVRAVTEAADPVRAVERLRGILENVPLHV